jgi:hypothetical protein
LALRGLLCFELSRPEPDLGIAAVAPFATELPSSQVGFSLDLRSESEAMIASIAAAILAMQIGVPSPDEFPRRQFESVQYRAFAHPPPCGHGYDLSARDGLCYPNGYLPPQEQAARQYPQPEYYRGGRYPVPCGHGADLDIRDGQCYPNGTVPRQFQQGRISRQPQYYGQDDYYERRARRRYYD